MNTIIKEGVQVHEQSLTQNTCRISRRRLLGGSGATLAALGLLATAGLNNTRLVHAEEGATRMSAETTSKKPVIVLVHGAWADGSSWSNVISRLQDDYTVVASALGLLSLKEDIASTRKFISDLGVPVLVVGHSYGGAVITGAASGLANVKGLVYVAAYAPDKGEVLLDLNTTFGQKYGPSPAGQYFRPDGPFDGDHPQTLVYLDRANFGSVFVQDIDKHNASVLAAVQRPIAVAAFIEPLEEEPAWKQVRTWFQVSTHDRTIQPDAERWMAQRMGASTVEIESSHASPVAHPGKIAWLIKQAAKEVA